MSAFDLGRPIGTEAQRPAPRDGFDEGEHGAGVGLSGGYDQPHGATQTFVPANLDSNTPIADKFAGQSGGAVSGAYASGGARDALTGQTSAHTTGAGVGYEAENLRSSAGRTGATEGYVGMGVGAVGGAGGHYHESAGREGGYEKGSALNSSSRGQPVIDPKHLDTGNKHSLVWQEDTQSYVHRRDL
ncbi:hypothetical protein Q5752_006181 [Cryptotrichosporon argae]